MGRIARGGSLGLRTRLTWCRLLKGALHCTCTREGCTCICAPGRRGERERGREGEKINEKERKRMKEKLEKGRRKYKGTLGDGISYILM